MLYVVRTIVHNEIQDFTAAYVIRSDLWASRRLQDFLCNSVVLLSIVRCIASCVAVCIIIALMLQVFNFSVTFATVSVLGGLYLLYLFNFILFFRISRFFYAVYFFCRDSMT